MTKRHLALASLALIAATSPARAVILYGMDNSANQTDPGSGAPWNAVAKVTDSTGASVNGSAVYLGNGYMITANHVALGSHVSFDGMTTVAVDSSFSSIQLSSGGVFADAKIFKLASTPIGINGVNLLSSGTENFWTGNPPANKNAAAVTLVGWGLGRDATAINSDLVGRGDNSTSAKRWGTNTLNNYSIVSVANQPAYSFVTTHLGPDSASEAGASLYDSGSGLFQKIGGTWYMVGLTTAITNRNGGTISTFGAEDYTGTNGDENIFVRMSTYSAQIQSLTAVPEPSEYAVCAGAMAIALTVRRRVQRRKSVTSAA